MHKVLVTGLGPVSSIGVGIEAYREALFAGKSNPAPAHAFDPTGFPVQQACEVADFDSTQYTQALDHEAWGRSSQFAAAAARLAAGDADLDLSQIDPSRAASVIGTTSGESAVSEQLTAQLLDRDVAEVSGTLAAQLPAARLADAVSVELGLGGQTLTVATACSASNYALGFGYDLIASGEADVVFAGGADAVCRWAHAGFYRLGALSPTPCAPFDRDRAGIITGEGGAVLVLESEEHARNRGARPHAELLGYGINCDAKHPVAPDADSIAACIRIAHRHAGIDPSQVDYICAHGTGTPANDIAETTAIRQVFGTSIPPLSSIKSMLGHTMGAASAFGAIASVLAITEGKLPPTINWAHADPDLGDIDPVPNVARAALVTVAQNNGFAFGGNNAIAIFSAVRSDA